VYIYPTNYPEGRLGAPFHGVYKILDNYHEWLVDAYPQEQRALYLSIYPFIHYKTVSPREKDKFPVRVMHFHGVAVSRGCVLLHRRHKVPRLSVWC
jgi:hypothetical protein